MQRRQIAGHFRHTLTARNDRDHGRMPQRELKSSIDQPHAMRATDRLQPRRAVQHLLRGRIIEPERPRAGAGGQNAGVIRPAHHQPDAPLHRQRQIFGQRLMLQQGIAARQQEKVEIAALGQCPAGLPFVHARTKGLDDALVAHLHQGAVAPGHELVQPCCQRLWRLVVEQVQIMGKQDIHPVQPQPLQAELQRPHRAVIAVIINLLARGHVVELADAVPLFPRFRYPQKPPDLGRDHIVLARLAAQEPVQAGF